MNQCYFFDMNVRDNSLTGLNSSRIEVLVTQKNKELIQLFLPEIDFEDNQSLFNLKENNLKLINKKLK